MPGFGSNCGRFLVLAALLSSPHLHSAGPTWLEPLPDLCRKTYQELEEYTNVEGPLWKSPGPKLGRCVPVAAWEELVSSLGADYGNSTENGTPVIVLMDNITAPQDAPEIPEGETATFSGPVIIAGSNLDGRPTRLEMRLVKWLRGMDVPSAQRSQIMLFNLALEPIDSLSLIDLSFTAGTGNVLQDFLMGPVVEMGVSELPPGSFDPFVVPDDMDALGEMFSPNGLISSLVRISGAPTVNILRCSMDIPKEYMGLSAFSMYLPRNEILGEYSRWQEVTPWQHSFLVLMTMRNTLRSSTQPEFGLGMLQEEGNMFQDAVGMLPDAAVGMFPGGDVPDLMPLTSPSGQNLFFEDHVYASFAYLRNDAMPSEGPSIDGIQIGIASTPDKFFFESAILRWAGAAATPAGRGPGGQQGGGSPECQTLTSATRGRDYSGSVSKSASGKDCLPWSEMERKGVLPQGMFPEVDDPAGKSCRNPADHAAVWCFVESNYTRTEETSVYIQRETGWEWEYCNVPACEVPGKELDCYKQEDFGESYAADGPVTSGRLSGSAPCLPWASVSPYLFGHIPGNACRNPFGFHFAPWCFTSDIDWQYCDVPLCGEGGDNKNGPPGPSSIPIIIGIAGALVSVGIFCGVGLAIFIRFRMAPRAARDAEEGLGLVNSRRQGSQRSLGSQGDMSSQEGSARRGSSSYTASSQGNTQDGIKTSWLRTGSTMSSATTASRQGPVGASLVSLGLFSINSTGARITGGDSVIFNSADIAHFFAKQDNKELARLVVVLAAVQVTVWRQILAIAACAKGSRLQAPAGMAGAGLPEPPGNSRAKWHSLAPEMVLGTEINCMDLFHGKLTDVLGHGATATVYKATWNSLEVAVKTFSVSSPTSPVSSNAAVSHLWNDKLKRQAFLSELWIMQDAAKGCDRIVRMLAHCSQPAHPCIIYEYMNGGTLSDLLAKKGPMGVLDALVIVRDIAEGLAHLHPGVIHRDLKPENVLIHDGRAKVGDLGLGQLKDPMNTYLDTSPAGTICYMAPEAFKRGKITHRSDIYALGVIMNEILTQKKPWPPEYSPYEVMFAVSIEGKRPDMPEHCGPGILKLISKCWAQEERKRPAAAEVCKMVDLLIDQHRTSMPGSTFSFAS